MRVQPGQALAALDLMESSSLMVQHQADACAALDMSCKEDSTDAQKRAPQDSVFPELPQPSPNALPLGPVMGPSPLQSGCTQHSDTAPALQQAAGNVQHKDAAGHAGCAPANEGRTAGPAGRRSSSQRPGAAVCAEPGANGSVNVHITANMSHCNHCKRAERGDGADEPPPAGWPGLSSAGLASYLLLVTTGSKPGSGTAAALEIAIHGERCVSARTCAACLFMLLDNRATESYVYFPTLNRSADASACTSYKSTNVVSACFALLRVHLGCSV